MKRKKWTEAEEETLINKYSDLFHSGTLPKLKTREKKYQPIADQVNSLHNLRDPISFPFRWSWRDVSIKVQNMRHQYLGVKQKIRVSDDEFNWNDAIDHWVNFFKYKDVFGDVELLILDNNNYWNRRSFISDEDDEEEECNGILGVASDCKDWDGIVDGGDHCEEGNSRHVKRKKLKKEGLVFLGTQLLELRDVIGKKEERERKRRFIEEEKLKVLDDKVRERETRNEDRMRDLEERMEVRELEWEARKRAMDKREMERQLRVEREFDEDRRRWLMKMEEKREEEEEEMGFKERMIQLQIEHEKQIMPMNVESCQNQMQVLGVLVRVVCQFFGSGNDGLSSGIGSISTPHEDHLHPGNLCGDYNGKPDGNSNSHHFM